jgi:hypothetical protein
VLKLNKRAATAALFLVPLTSQVRNIIRKVVFTVNLRNKRGEINNLKREAQKYFP